MIDRGQRPATLTTPTDNRVFVLVLQHPREKKEALATAPARLAAMAAAARSLGRLDAADRLADLVLKVAASGANK